MSAELAKSGKVMHIPGISKKRKIPLTSTHLMYLMCIMFFQVSFSSLNVRIPFLQELRGNNQPVFLDPNGGYSILMPQGNNLVVQYIIFTVIAFFVSYHHIFMHTVRSIKYILTTYLLGFVIAALACTSLPAVGNYSDQTFSKWASERYGISLEMGDKSSFYDAKILIKDSKSPVAYELTKVNGSYYVYDLNGEELPTINNMKPVEK